MSQRSLIRQAIDMNHASVREFRQHIGLVGRYLRWPIEKTDAIQLVASEWLTNLVQHEPGLAVNAKLAMAGGEVCLTFDRPSYEVQSAPELPDEMSESGRGLWLIEAYTDRADYAAHSTTFSWSLAVGYKRPSVLLVDDDPVALAIVESYLTNEYRVLTAPTAEQALCLLGRESVDLIVSDVDMPTESGHDFRSRLLKRRSTDLTPFVFLSGHPQQGNEDAGASVFIDRYLQKPVTKQHFLQACHQTITSQRIVAQRLLDRFLSSSAKHSLIDKVPDLPGVSVHAKSKNLGHGGGDFFVSQTLQHGQVFIVGDAIGHDLTSQWFAHLWVGYLRGILLGQTDLQQLEGLIEMIDRAAMDNDDLADAMVTLCAVYRSNSGWIQIACLGHPLPLRVRDSQVDQIGEQLGILGLAGLGGASLPKIEWRSADRLVVFTDGLVETRSGDETFGHHQSLERVLLELNGSSSSELPDRLLNAKSNSLSDDTTVVVLEELI